MASTSPLQADRTDEFFSKVVDDKYGANHLEPEDMRAQSNFSLGEVENSGSASEVNGQKDRQSWSFSVASKNDASTGEQSKVLTEGAETVGTKGASFKEIQWSAFSVNSEEFGLGDSESDLFLGGEYGSLVNSETFSESKSTLLENTAGSISSHAGSNEHQCAQAYGSISEQSANLIEMKNQENLYPGWKYDTSTGQCYQPNDYNATTHTQSDILSIANANTHENSETKVQKASEGSEFDISDDVNLLHQTSPPVLETISDDSSILKSRNPVSQENREYPPNMLFDPQYPQWYYDTITQMWCTLESYDHSLHDASNLTQDPLTIDENASVNVQNAFEGSASEILDAVNLQQTSHPVLETIYEGSCVLNSRNQYPSNMVFDPQYPEWYYDTSTQKWYTLESYNHALHDASNVTKGQLAGNANALDKIQNTFEGSVPEISDHVNLQQTSQPVLETISEESTVFNSRSLVPQDSYPPNMVFDPQYPEWYYDTITQMWCTLESYNHLHDASSAIQGLQSNNVNALAGLSIDNHHLLHDSHAQSGQYTKLEQSSQKSGWIVPEGGFKKHSNWKEKSGPEGHWNASDGGYGLPSLWQEQTIKESYSKASGNYDLQKTWQPELLAKNGDAATVLSNQLTGSFHGSQVYTGSHPANQLEPINLEPIVKHDYGRNNMISARRYVSSESILHTNQPNMEQSFPAHLSNSGNGTESSINYAQQSFQCANPSYSQFSYTPNEVRSTAGRPPHALVTFGFGGKVIVMKDSSFSSSSFVSGSQGTVGGVVLIHNLMDVVMTKADFLNTSTVGRFGYFHTLCQESFPGPLVGGNAASKDVNKWIDDRITSIESSSMDFQNGLLLRLLLSLLKILCQYYGRLRSPYGIETLHEGSDGPELAVSKLFASAKRNNTPFGGGSSMRCMKNPPSEGNIRATATEVQNLLVSGRRKEALQHAQEGQLWGTAVVLAAQLGEQFYVDTVKQMALRQFVCGSPLRTLYLLIAGQPADVFSADCSSSDSSGTVERPYQSSEGQQNGLLDDWQENLAIIASNRTKDDELVIIHLGDCLWKERGEVTAAHACYLLAEVNIEPYSDSARLCLIGADHWKNSRTYACPDFIQRTEIYEYSKVIGNSQFVLLPFQPYKLVYAYMLAEVGKVSDSLRYCQASMKMLKNSGRSPEVELWRALFSSLEERLRTHQQSGYGTNLASTKLVGKLFNSIDRSIHRMIGIPPLPPTLRNSGDGRDNNSQVQKVSSSQSAMAITSLIPSSSVEAISERTGDSSRKVGHNRSISEPDFGRNTKMNSTKDGSSYGQGNASISGGPSRFGRFGFQLLQKTIGWVSWPRHDRQAKLGESNKFYYDDKLKRWVEEGAELPAAEASLPPPPIVASFQNGKSDYDIKNAFKSDSLVMDAKQETKFDGPSEQGFGLPPVPPSQNQFSARNRGMVRSRYVDTFNKGGGSFTSTFQTPSAPSVKPLSVANFFVPSAPNQTNDASIRACIDESTITEEPSTSAVLPSLTPFSSSMQRFPSMDNITTSQSLPSGSSSFSRRAASWSGAYPAISNTKAVGMEQHSSVVSGVAPTFPPQNGTLHTESSSSSSQQLDADCSVLEDLHEVEL